MSGQSPLGGVHWGQSRSSTVKHEGPTAELHNWPHLVLQLVNWFEVYHLGFCVLENVLWMFKGWVELSGNRNPGIDFSHNNVASSWTVEKNFGYGSIFFGYNHGCYQPYFMNNVWHGRSVAKLLHEHSFSHMMGDSIEASRGAPPWSMRAPWQSSMTGLILYCGSYIGSRYTILAFVCMCLALTERFTPSFPQQKPGRRQHLTSSGAMKICCDCLKGGLNCPETGIRELTFLTIT